MLRSVAVVGPPLPRDRSQATGRRAAAMRQGGAPRGAPGAGGNGSGGSGAGTMNSCKSSGAGLASSAGGASPGGCVTVGIVHGAVLDEAGQVPSKRLVTVCSSACFQEEIADDGTFTIAPQLLFRAVALLQGSDLRVPRPPDQRRRDRGVRPRRRDRARGRGRWDHPHGFHSRHDAGAVRGARRCDVRRWQRAAVTVDACTVELFAFEENVVLGEVALSAFPRPTVPDPPLTALSFIGPDDTLLSSPTKLELPNDRRSPLAPRSRSSRSGTSAQASSRRARSARGGKRRRRRRRHCHRERSRSR